MSDNSKIIMFTLAMTTVVALILGSLFFGLKPIHDKNQAISNKRAILNALGSNLPSPVAELSDDEVLDLFKNNITQYVVKPTGELVEDKTLLAENVNLAVERKKSEADRLYPVFKYNNGKEDYYIISIRGNGLWDEIWGNIALKSDLTTIAGASFDHKGETPGLGAEIKDNKNFSLQFRDKKIFNKAGEFTSVVVRKGGAQNPTYEVDGISGATVTCVGVSDMLANGISKYLPYFKNVKKHSAAGAVGMLN